MKTYYCGKDGRFFARSEIEAKNHCGQCPYGRSAEATRTAEHKLELTPVMLKPTPLDRATTRGDALAA